MSLDGIKTSKFCKPIVKNPGKNMMRINKILSAKMQLPDCHGGNFVLSKTERRK